MLADLRQFRLITPKSEALAPEPRSNTIEGLLQALRIPGRVCELSGSASSGKSTLALRLCLLAMQEGMSAAWIDPTGAFWPLAALEQYGALDQLLVVRVSDGVQALRAADVILAAPGAVALVVVHLPPNHRPSDGQLFRLQRLAEKSETTLLLLDERPTQATSLSPSVTIRVSAERVPAANDDWALQLNVQQHKHGTAGLVEETLSHRPLRLAFGGSL